MDNPPQISSTPIPPLAPKPFPLNTVLIALTLATLLITGFIIYQMQHLRGQLNQVIQTQSASPTISIPPTITSTPMKTYSNPKYGYEFNYPANLRLYQENEMDKAYNLTMIPVCSLASTDCLYLDANQYPDDRPSKSNFRGAAFSVNLLQKSNTRAKCDQSTIPGGKYTGNKTINQITYRTFTFDGAATGNQSHDYIYITFQNNLCFEIIERITTDSSDVNAMPAGSVKPFTESDQINLISLFNQILTTFRFTN